MTKIICAFAGTGKTIAAQNTSWHARDSDSDEFRWLNWDAARRRQPEDQNPAWPQNFIDHAITEYAKGDFDAILLSAYVELLPRIAVHVPLTYVYPSPDMKDEFETRYRRRGNSQRFIDLLIGNFDTWITALMAMDGDHVILQPGQYLADVLPEILARP